jgi:hypothetical protein
VEKCVIVANAKKNSDNKITPTQKKPGNQNDKTDWR